MNKLVLATNLPDIEGYPNLFNSNSAEEWNKILKRICTLSKDLRFDELRKVLESYGYVMNAPRGGSSHYTFRKSGCQPITIPKYEPIKKVYVEMVRQIVESEAKNDEDPE